MSVINDMLRDLDKRQAPEVSAGQTSHQDSLIEPQSSPVKKIIIIVVLVLSILFLAGFLFLNKEPASLEPIVTNEDAKHSIAQSNNVNVQQEALKEISQDIAQKDRTLNNIDLERPIEKLQKNSNKGDELAVLSNLNLEEPTVLELKEVEPASSEIIKEQRNKNQIQQEKPADSQEIKANSKSVVASKAVIAKTVTAKTATTKTEKTKPQKAVLQEQKAYPEIKEKTMHVTLSPVALDQQMAERALMLISKMKDTEAYRELYTFIGEHEEDMESRTVLANYLLQENRIIELGDVLLNAPLSKSPKLRQIKARWFAEQGKYKLALYTLNSDLPRIETNSEYYVLLAAYYQRYGTAAEAKETYSRLVDYDETVADWWAGLGLASDRNNEKNKAIYAYQQSLELKGLSPELLNFVKPRLELLLASNLN